MFKSSLRFVMQSWAKTGIAPGYLHSFVDKYSKRLSNKPLWREITGNNHILCSLNDHVQSRIYFMGAYEPIEAWLVVRLLSSIQNPVVLDVGANVGFYSLLLSGASQKVYSFEPVPDNYNILKHNISRSLKNGVVQTVNKGLWNQKDTLTIGLDKKDSENQGSFTMGKLVESSSEFECQVITLDDFVNDEQVSRVDFIKMDIEGAELNALRGSLETLAKYRPNLLIEFNKEAADRFGYSLEELFDLLRPFDYKAFLIGATPEKSRRVESADGILQENVFFLNQVAFENFKSDWCYKSIKKQFANNAVEV